MTVSSTSNRKEYTGNGVTTVFAFPYKFIATTDIKVYVAGVLQTSGYTVGTPSDSGANVTFSVAPANLSSVVIINDPDLLQSSALPATGPFPSTTVERMVDKATLQVQRIRDLINRSFTLPDSDTSGASTTLPTPTAANIIGWNSLGNALKNYTPTELGITVAAGNQTVEYFSGTGAQTQFTLTGNPVSNENTEVFVSGVRQYPGSGKDYLFDSSTKIITFASAPASGTSNVMVRYGGAADIGVPSDGTVGTAKIADGAVTPAKTSGFGAWVTAASAALARTALGLGTASTKDTGTSAGQVVVLDGSAKLPAVDGSQLTGIATGGGVLGAYRNLAISANGTGANVTVTADELVLENASNAYYTARSVSLTINTAGSGANGLDTGSIAGSTWYSVWAIYNGTTVSGLISTSATAPTMPSGYTYKARIGWIRTDGTANKYPLGFNQKGRIARYVVAAGTNVTAHPVMATSGAAVGTATTGTYVAVGVSNFVPPTASVIAGNIASGGTTAVIVAPNSAYGGYTSTTNPPVAAINPSSGYSLLYDITLESTNIYWAANSAGGMLTCRGWEDNL